MKTQTKIIIGIVVASAVIGGAYYFYKKSKAKAEKPSIDTKTTTGEYIAKDDERFGKGLGVLALPKKPIPTNTTTNTTIPNFTKGIF